MSGMRRLVVLAGVRARGGDPSESSPKRHKRATAVTGKRPSVDGPHLDAADGELRRKIDFRENGVERT